MEMDSWDILAESYDPERVMRMPLGQFEWELLIGYFPVHISLDEVYPEPGGSACEVWTDGSFEERLWQGSHYLFPNWM